MHLPSGRLIENSFAGATPRTTIKERSNRRRRAIFRRPLFSGPRIADTINGTTDIVKRITNLSLG